MKMVFNITWQTVIYHCMTNKYKAHELQNTTNIQCLSLLRLIAVSCFLNMIRLLHLRIELLEEFNILIWCMISNFILSKVASTQTCRKFQIDHQTRILFLPAHLICTCMLNIAKKKWGNLFWRYNNGKSENRCIPFCAFLFLLFLFFPFVMRNLISCLYIFPRYRFLVFLMFQQTGVRQLMSNIGTIRICYYGTS